MSLIVPTTDPWDPGPLDGRVNHDCEFLFGYPFCMGAAARDDCSCNHLTALQQIQAQTNAHAAAAKRRGAMCSDCFFRSGDPEDAFHQRELARLDAPLRCHVFVPLHAIGGDVQRDSFAHRNAELYPICAGWKRWHKRIVGVRNLLVVRGVTEAIDAVFKGGVRG